MTVAISRAGSQSGCRVLSYLYERREFVVAEGSGANNLFHEVVGYSMPTLVGGQILQ